MDAQSYQNAGDVFGLVFRYAAIAIIVAGFVLYVMQRYAIVSIMKNILAWMLIILGALLLLIFGANALFNRLSIGSIQISIALVIGGYLLKQWRVGESEQKWITFDTNRFDIFRNHRGAFTITSIAWTICLLAIMVFVTVVLVGSFDMFQEPYFRWNFRIAFNLFATLFFLIVHLWYLAVFYRSVFTPSDEYDSRRRMLATLALIALFIKLGALLTYPQYHHFILASILIIPMQLIVYFGQENYLASKAG